MIHRHPSFLPLLTLVAAAACADSDPVAPDVEEVAALTIDASDGWGLATLNGGDARAVVAADPASSDAWDLGFFATSVMLNGGAAGPGDVVGHCLCQNATASDAQVAAFTAESELADFEAVTEAQIPAAEEAWTSDALVAAIDGWYSYDRTTHVVSAAPAEVWKFRTASGSAYAKFHVTALEGPTRDHAGRVTLEYALQPAAGSPFETARTPTIDLSSGPVHFDLETGTVVDASADWDLLFDGYDIRVNGGVSGPGSAGASPADRSFEAIDDAGDLTAGHYRGDAFGGVFDQHRWYRYDIEGNHQVWPTFDVYLVRRGDAVYKVQLTSYYGPTGDSRRVTFRYARLR